MGQATSDGEMAEPISSAEMNRHPTGLWFFFWGEFAERCSYYGMRTILYLYLVGDATGVIKGGLHLGAQGKQMYFAFKMACYFLPLIGGYVADRFFGKYWTIVGFSIPYVLGHFILGIETLPCAAIALILLAGGSGVIKPNISTLMGQTYDQQRPGMERLRSVAFQIFYFSINVGAVISTFALPILRTKYNYAVAFQFPAWLMVISLFVFAMGKRYYAVETPGYRPKSGTERREQWKTLLSLLGIFGMMVFWWTAYEQTDSLWVDLAKDHMNLTLPILGKLNADQVQFLNPACVLLFVPLFTWLFGKLDPQTVIFTPMRKILAGFLVTVISIGLLAVVGFVTADGTTKMSVAWLGISYILLTAGEVLLYGTGLELAYTAAPKSMKGFVTACFLVPIGLADLANILIAPSYGESSDPSILPKLAPGPYFAIMAAMVLLAAIGFYFVGRRFDKSRATNPVTA
jgi:dipeptide/tripeptide permease